VSGEAFKNKDISNNVSAQFSLPYVIAAAANRVSLAEWQDPARISDRNILSFMDKVFQEVHPDFVKVQLKEPLSNMTTVEVMSNGKTFKEEGKYPKGLPEPDFARMTDVDLVEKFKVNVSKVLPQDRVEKAVAILMNLEKSGDIPDVVKQVTL
jgi:2-methylcitrate dehydratase PrpD